MAIERTKEELKPDLFAQTETRESTGLNRLSPEDQMKLMLRTLKRAITERELHSIGIDQSRENSESTPGQDH